jgi:Zn-dependent membrane protease YugP
MISIWHLIFTLPGVLMALWAQMRLRSAYARYSELATDYNLTGVEAARTILDRNGLNHIEIYEVEGELTDHYDPSRRAVFLSSANYHSNSIAAVGVAAHEVGHALQHQNAYAFLGLRMAMVPLTNIASNLAMIVIFAGVMLNAAIHGVAVSLVWLGVALFSIVWLFQLITLPVEYDASSRAKVQLERLGLVSPRERNGVGEVLSAAGLTYVAAMLTSMLQLLYFIGVARNVDREDQR